YLLKKRIGYGNIYKIKNKNAYNLIISKTEGIIKIINLINGKLRLEKKINQLKELIYLKNNLNFNIENIKLNNNPDLKKDYWLAGFSDGDSSFQIKILKRNKKKEIRLNFQIDQKKEELLKIIK